MAAHRLSRSILEAVGPCAAGLLTNGSASFGAFPPVSAGSGRIKPCRRTPQLQWRARAGISPASLFSPQTLIRRQGAPHAILFPSPTLGQNKGAVNSGQRLPQGCRVLIESPQPRGGSISGKHGEAVIPAKAGIQSVLGQANFPKTRGYGFRPRIRVRGRLFAGMTVSGRAEVKTRLP